MRSQQFRERGLTFLPVVLILSILSLVVLLAVQILELLKYLQIPG